MLKKLDKIWLKDQAADSATLEWLEKVLNLRQKVEDTNILSNDMTEFELHLGNHIFAQNFASSFSSIEIYQEIFRDKSHFLAPGFSGENAETVLDIGANEGFYIMRLKEINPSCRLIAVEPNPFMFYTLAKNIKNNYISNVTLARFAIADCDSYIPFEIIPQIGSIGGCSVRIPERKWLKDEFVSELTVKAISLDTLLNDYNLTSVDLMKMDAEGMEIEILSSCKNLNRFKRIVIEYHSNQGRNILVKLLADNNFDVVFEDHENGSYYGDLYFINRSQLQTS